MCWARYTWQSKAGTPQFYSKEESKSRLKRGSRGKATYHQAWWPEVNPLDTYGWKFSSSLSPLFWLTSTSFLMIHPIPEPLISCHFWLALIRPGLGAYNGTGRLEWGLHSVFPKQMWVAVAPPHGYNLCACRHNCDQQKQPLGRWLLPLIQKDLLCSVTELLQKAAASHLWHHQLDGQCPGMSPLPSSP